MITDITVHPRREWKEEDESKFREFVNKEGYDSWKLRMERLICEWNEDLIRTKDVAIIQKIEALSTAIRICDNARQ